MKFEPTRLISILCESLNRYDLVGCIPAGFAQHDLDLHPALISVDALYEMETEFPREHANGSELFSVAGAFLANHVRTRLISNYWPRGHDPIFLDPLASRKVHEDDDHKRMEPDCHHFGMFVDFIRNEFYSSVPEYRHLIYWPYTGHAGLKLRVPEDNHGIPADCSRTWRRWIAVLQEHVFPLIHWDRTVVLIHPDHGTNRKGIAYERAMRDGFLLAWHPGHKPAAERQLLTWADLRQTEQAALGINFFFKGTECIWS